MGKKLYRTDISEKRRRERIAFISGVLLSVALLLFAAVLGFLLYWPWFRVKSVAIEGAGYIPEDQVRTFLRASVPGQGFWGSLLGYRNMLNWPDAFTGDELKLLPDAKEIKVEKSSLEHSVKIIVTPRTRKGIVCFRKSEPARCAWFDEEGRILGRAPETEGPLLLFLNDYSRSNGEGYLVGQRFVENLFSVFEALRGMPVAVKEVRLENPELEEVKVPTFLGPDLYFSLRFPASEVPAGYAALHAKTAVSGLEYIDFRTQNRVYYK